MAKNDLCIDILGTKITISADEDSGYLEMLLEKYRQTVENVKAMSGINDPLGIAVLTGFLLCDDLEKAGNFSSPAVQNPEAERLTLGMISALESLMASDTPPAAVSIPEDSAGAPVFRLQNTVKNYEWGSAEWIPKLMGRQNLSRIPWAELWMGVNPAGPSRLLPEGKGGGTDGKPLLSEFIARDPRSLLGDYVFQKFGKLPFLFKVEAVARPLSLQVHPNLEQAREGYESEKRRGIPLDAVQRNYRDVSHKPEIICALSTFAALCGFKKPQQISTLINILSENSSGRLKGRLDTLASLLDEADEPLKAAFTALFDLPPEIMRELGELIKSGQDYFVKEYPEYSDEWKLCSFLQSVYPDDTGIAAPLFLNIVEINPGEALCFPAGIIHCYIHGFGIELMADTDNVLRAALTSKHKDRKELVRVLNFSPFMPEILKAPEESVPCFTYPSPFEEFKLSVFNRRGGRAAYPEKGPSILIVTHGSAELICKGEKITLAQGESVFIPAGQNKSLEFSGIFKAYAASVAYNGSPPEAAG